ncbi:MAG: efflux RND transporter periplasmic adaptor subunit, partial [Candidatus Cloacimonetes bacterium]|nr:efflux RND transporter periplasmic adaptor subunit [Candidatus Cloacimonadota bacterium]
MISCSKNDKNTGKNLDQIYAEEGIPVKIEVIQPRDFVKSLNYNATLTGIRQSSASAMIGGRIEKIHVQVGDYVEKDQVLMEFPEDTPSAQYHQAKSAYELAKATFERMQNLYELGGISKQDLESAETQFKVSEANWDAVQQMLKVRAPISGYVSSLTVRETDGVQSENILATVSQTDQMKATVWVTEDEICALEKDMKAEAKWNDLILEGRVSEVAMSMNSEYNAFAVNLTFDNPAGACRSGVIGEISIFIYRNPYAFIIERKNISQDDDGTYIFLAQNNEAVKKYVKTGRENGSYEILEGVSLGDSVIVESLNLVSNGVKIKIIE